MVYRFGLAIGRQARTVLLLTAALFTCCVMLGVGAFNGLLSGGFADPRSESSQVQAAVDDGFGGSGTFIFLVQARAGTVDDPAVAASGAQLSDRLTADRRLSGVSSYWPDRPPVLASRDHKQALIVAHVPGDESSRAEASAGVLADYQSLDDNFVTVRLGGSEGTDIGSQVARDLAVAEAIAVPVTLLLLVVAFGSLVAALLPLGVAALAVVATFALLNGLTEITEVSVFAINLATALGLGLGVDYCLLIVGRFRDELAEGHSVLDAVAHTTATAGRTVMFSALAVAAALAAMLVFPNYLLKSFAYAGVAVTVFAAAAALVVLPAALAVLGQRVNAGKVPGLQPIGASESPLWRRAATQVMRRPALIALPAIALLLFMALPLAQVQFATPDARSLPATNPAHQVSDVLRDRFATQLTTIDVIVQARFGTSLIPAAALAAYARQLSVVPHIQLVLTPVGVFAAGDQVASAAAAAQGRTLVAGQNQRVELTTGLDSAAPAAQTLVQAVRALPAPEGAAVVVGGATAALLDAKRAVASAVPAAAALITITTLVLLFLFTGSIVQPLRALGGNLLTLTATLGVSVWIFQEGHLQWWLSFTPHPLDTSTPVLLFCIIFGLSMDYEVFLISRIKELHDAGADVATSTIHGLARTGRLVSPAAALLAVSFFAFATAQVSFIQLLGVGAGLAILLDATLVRGVLVPASMRLLGERGWWSPPAFRRLHHRFGLSDAATVPGPHTTSTPRPIVQLNRPTDQTG